jgi:hypothetical protein
VRYTWLWGREGEGEGEGKEHATQMSRWKEERERESERAREKERERKKERGREKARARVCVCAHFCTSGDDVEHVDNVVGAHSDKVTSEGENVCHAPCVAGIPSNLAGEGERK